MIKRQAQSMPVAMSDLNELQQPEVGEDPLPLLPVMKFRHGVKLLIIDAVHGVLICPLTEMTKRTIDMATKC